MRPSQILKEILPTIVVGESNKIGRFPFANNQSYIEWDVPLKPENVVGGQDAAVNYYNNNGETPGLAYLQSFRTPHPRLIGETHQAMRNGAPNAVVPGSIIPLYTYIDPVTGHDYGQFFRAKFGFDEFAQSRVMSSAAYRNERMFNRYDLLLEDYLDWTTTYRIINELAKTPSTFYYCADDVTRFWPSSGRNEAFTAGNEAATVLLDTPLNPFPSWAIYLRGGLHSFDPIADFFADGKEYGRRGAISRSVNFLEAQGIDMFAIPEKLGGGKKYLLVHSEGFLLPADMSSKIYPVSVPKEMFYYIQACTSGVPSYGYSIEMGGFFLVGYPGVFRIIAGPKMNDDIKKELNDYDRQQIMGWDDYAIYASARAPMGTCHKDFNDGGGQYPVIPFLHAHSGDTVRCTPLMATQAQLILENKPPDIPKADPVPEIKELPNKTVKKFTYKK